MKCEHNWCLMLPRMGLMRYECSKCGVEMIVDD